MTDALLARVMAKVGSGTDSECWPWLAYINAGGYGRVTVNGKQRYAHRVVYELLVGPIPQGLQIDHLCRNRACVNPAHLEPVAPRINTLRGESSQAQNARKTACHLGHPFDYGNTYRRPDGRACRACQMEASRKYRERKSA